MSSAASCLDIQPACAWAPDERGRAAIASLLLAAAQPYARALYGDDETGAAIFAALMSRSASECSAARVQVLLEDGELSGCYAALPGGDLAACRRTELLEALRHFGAGAGLLRTRLAALDGLFSPVAGDEFYLGKLAVRSGAGRRGLGRLLLGRYLAQGQQLGFRRFRLDVCADNSAARRLYESAGFHPVEQRSCARFGLTYLAMRAER